MRTAKEDAKPEIAPMEFAKGRHIPSVKILNNSDPLNLRYIGNQYKYMLDLFNRYLSFNERTKKEARDVVKNSIF